MSDVEFPSHDIVEAFLVPQLEFLRNTPGFRARALEGAERVHGAHDAHLFGGSTTKIFEKDDQTTKRTCLFFTFFLRHFFFFLRSVVVGVFWGNSPAR